MSAQKILGVVGRRRFVTSGACLVCAAWLGGCRGEGGSAIRGPVTIPLGPATSFPLGATVRLVERVVVVRDEGGFGVMSLRCTHQDCLVTYGGEFEPVRCPCHGATFSPTGRVLSGPATIDLPWYATAVTPLGGLEVTLGAVVPSSERFPWRG
jgi:nitrite reductase/ring-hydroxylating ferredoxin subunit